MNIIPKPQSLKTNNGFFRILPKTRILLSPYNLRLKKIAKFLTDPVANKTGMVLPVVPGSSFNTCDILLSLEKTGLGEEGYKLNVNARYVKLAAEEPAGLFYGIQTLLQLFPPEIFGKEVLDRLEIPVCVIEDKPHFSWRGMHLDVSRHFFPVDFIKRYIDNIAFHKMNKFHWHLTDDNGWRIEINKYPKLQEISAWRVDREGIDWLDRKPAQEGEKATYGGYYTQAEVREIIKYAAERYVEIIPEIEMPGHSCEVLAAYPELGCFNEETSVVTGTYWPNKDIFCAGKEQTFAFLQDVLDEVVELFPSKYIHIGGDEAHKSNWKKCPNCQKRITDEGLKDTNELQSWFIKRIETYLLSKGRSIIGWDEILEGGLAPEATVMSWRGMDGGIAAAKEGHNVIMTPGTHCYFDHYQGEPLNEKKAIGGYTSLKKVYHFDPVPAELSEKEKQHILGAQGNVWTEWIPTEEHAEYMSTPRMAALAEVVWAYARVRDWDDFLKRIQTQYLRYKKMGINYCPGTSVIEIDPIFNKNLQQYELYLSSEIYNEPIYYTLDGSNPDFDSSVYSNKIIIKDSTTVKAATVIDGKITENPSNLRIDFHKAMGVEIDAVTLPSDKYGDLGVITDGISGSLNHNDGYWCGFLGKSPEFIIDLKTSKQIKLIDIGTLHNTNSWVFRPDSITLEYSNDGENWLILDNLKAPIENDYPKVKKVDFTIKCSISTRFLKISIKALEICPDWFVAKGDPCWMFIDEIVVQ